MRDRAFNRFMRSRMTSALIVALVAMTLAPSIATAQGSFQPPVSANDSAPTAEARGYIRQDGDVVIETLDPTIDTESPEILETIENIRERGTLPDQPVGPSSLPPGTAGLNGSLRARFVGNVPADVQGVINTALAQWDAALVTPTPITVDVYWECFNNPGILGFAGPLDIYQATDTGLIFPAAVAHTLESSDLNGGTSEIEMGLNAELASSNSCSFATDEWYISSTSANPGSGQIDLYSVVLHEIGHGLGFLGSAQDPDGAGPITPRVSFPRFVYDTFVTVGNTPLLDTANPNSHLTQGNLFFDIGGGTLHDVYAPNPFRNGSSFSHFSFAFQGNDPGVLMTPALGSGQIRRALDAPVLGVLSQQGWDIVPRAVAPVVTANGSDGEITASWDPNLGGYGTPPLQYEIRAIRNGKVEATQIVPGSARSIVLNQLLNGQTYILEISPIDRHGRSPATVTNVTLPSIPNKPQYLQSNGVGLNRIVSWLAPVAVNGGTLTYTVQSRPIYGSSWSTVGTTTSTSISTGTLPEGVYQFRVRATNNNGTGSYSYSTMIGVSPTVVRPLPLDGQVARLYSAYFLRQPDQAGYDYWVGLRASGTTLAAISAAFEGSPEFNALYGSLSDSQFIDQVYQNVQGRPADAGGKTFWLAFLAAGNSRGDLMIGFSESAEYISSTGTASPTDTGEGPIYRLYLSYFLREPDAAGLAFWTGQLDNGSSLIQISNQFTRSPEFEAEYGSLTNQRFVELVYANVLTRPADSAGVTYWVNQLNTGATSRGEMMVGFANSPEFILRTGSLPL